MFKFDLPKHRLILPMSGKEIYVYQYNRAQEKKLLMASSTEDISEAFIAIFDVLSECAPDVDIKGLHPLDYEFLFVKLKCLSDTNLVKVVMGVESCTTEDCPTEIHGAIDLNKVNFDFTDVTFDGFIEKGDTMIYQVNETSGIIFNKMNMHVLSALNPLYELFSGVYTIDGVKMKSEIGVDEFESMIDSLPSFMVSQIESYIVDQPSSSYNISCKCPVCKQVHTRTLSGIAGFFF